MRASGGVSAEYGIKGGEEHVARRRQKAMADDRIAIREQPISQTVAMPYPHFLLRRAQLRRLEKMNALQRVRAEY